MIVALVAVGQYALGAPGTKIYPLLPGQTMASGKRYNSLVDKIQSPSIFVVQHSAQAYPAYVVTYKRQ